jgi:hypothetical protein
MQIIEYPNPDYVKMPAIQEKQDIYIPGIVDQNIPTRNGFVYVSSGSGGSGKSSLMLNMFKSKMMYKGKFHNLFYICPEVSFLSVKSHPFENHDKVYHDLTVPILEDIYQFCKAIKDRAEERAKKRKQKALEKKKGSKIQYEEGEEDEDEEEDDEDDIQYTCVIIDDYADSLKDKEIQRQLSKMLIKARHLCCSFIFTLQSYYYFPKILRKQITNVTIFKPKNIEEWHSITKEVLKYNKDDGMILYDYIFDAPYTHLDLNTVTNQYYKNFNLLSINGA